MNNKKAQSGPIGIIILLLMFIVMWFLFIGEFLGDVGQSAITDNSLTGLPAWAFANLNFIVLICFILGMLGAMYFIGGQQ